MKAMTSIGVISRGGCSTWILDCGIKVEGGALEER